MNLAKLVSLSIALLLILAFKHPIEIEGVGDVTSLSGTRGCTYEDATATPVPDNCAKNEVFWRVKNEAKKWVPVDYQETYIAVPRDGWQFDSWANCAFNGVGSTVEIGNTCTFSVPATAVRTEKRATIPPLKAVFTTCTPGTAGCAWKTGNLTTWTQGVYGDSATAAAMLLATNFEAQYLSDLIIGGGFTARFTSAAAVYNFLPQGGTPGAFTQNLSNPTTSSAGDFAGHMVALTINIDLSDAGLLASTAPLRHLTICGYAPVPGVNGMTVGEFYDLASIVLGGGNSTSLDPEFASIVAGVINSAFLGGTPSTFAQNNLHVGACTI